MLGENLSIFLFFNDTATTEIYTLSLHDALPIFMNTIEARDGISTGISAHDRSHTIQVAVSTKDRHDVLHSGHVQPLKARDGGVLMRAVQRSEEHTSELQSRRDLVCRLLLEKKKK